MLNRLRTLISAVAVAAGVIAQPAAAQPPTVIIPAGTVQGIVHTSYVPMKPPLILTHTSAWSPAGEPVTAFLATEARPGHAICLSDGQIAVHDSTIEWRILGTDPTVCAYAFGNSAAMIRAVVPPGRYALLIASGGEIDTLALTATVDRTVVGPKGRQHNIQLSQRLSWRTPARSFVMWCSPKRPDGRECEAMRAALAAEPDLMALPADDPQVASGYGHGHPLPSVAWAYRYVWDAEFDRVREMVRESGLSHSGIAGCSEAGIVNWRGEKTATTPCPRRPGR